MDRVAISFGSLSITWYSIFILIGVFLGGYIVNKEAKRNEMPTYFISNLVFWCVVFGILGARIYYVLFNLDYYLSSPLEIFKIWNGGLAIHGGLIAGCITLVIYSKKYKANILKMLDIVTPGLILAQGIGRWGNFFNQEAYGSSVTRGFLEKLHIPEFIIDGMYINEEYYHPTFLYESVFCLIGFFVLLGIRGQKNSKVGNTFGTYLIWYGAVRFFIESLRTDSLMLGNLKVAQLVSILMIIIGIITLVITKIKGKDYEDIKVSENEIKI